MAVLTAPRKTARGRTAGRPPARKRATRVPPVVLAFVLIPLLAEAFWVFWPAIQGVYLSFTKWDGVSAPEFIGLGNFREMSGDAVFRTAALDTVIWLVLFGGLSAALGLGAALLLQQERRGVGFYRAALFLPVVFSLVATALVWQAMYQPDGLINKTLEA
ncbi:carbohydrate ABC transporter permease, partial [Streptomyces sp. NPDC056730]|uniref:carbohydrate ABC transporter permease n=1 Tax=Streptomyces sp. NPDC056730 TaxID=3345929 RepID=UPI0036CAD8D4